MFINCDPGRDLKFLPFWPELTCNGLVKSSYLNIPLPIEQGLRLNFGEKVEPGMKTETAENY
jgi:hypothetical protein